MQRRDFLKMLSLAAGSGAMHASLPRAEAAAHMMYDPPRFGNLSLLHFADTHGQLLPSFFREASCHIGVGAAANQAPFLVGEGLLEYFRVYPQSLRAHAFTHLQFEDVARIYGKAGGFAHLATLIKGLRAGRPESLLLDSGDTWQGSALSLWTRGRSMVDATRLLGVDAMTGDWEFALGARRLQEIIGGELDRRTSFLAQNVTDGESDEPVFAPHATYFVGGTAVAVIGQAYPHVGDVGGRDFAPRWKFGIAEERLQQHVRAVRAKGAAVVVLLSHMGMPADLKLAARIAGIDVILGGHSHDIVPEPVVVSSSGGGRTVVTNAGSGGKFFAVLDLKVKAGRVVGYQYHLLPVFANLLPADPEMSALIGRWRDPHARELDEVLAVTEGVLYRRGNFNGTFDQLILDAVREVKSVEVAFSPGYRWGPTLLAGDAITIERLFDQTAVQAPDVRIELLSGREIFDFLEGVADRVFNADPYRQIGEDMVRVAGMSYEIDPAAGFGRRVRNLRIGDAAVDAGKRYKVASWGYGRAGQGGEPIWHVVGRYLRQTRHIAPIAPNVPGILGIGDNRGFA